jgi:predicted ferric reductase
MRRIAWTFGAVLLALLSVWWLSTPLAGLPPDVFAWRGPMLQGTGSLAIGVMSVAMVLATRPALVEPWFGGLDKMYRLHKWLGIAALVLAVGHWLWVEAPKWLVGLGWLVSSPRVPSAQPASPVLQFFHGLRDAAESIGEWAFYALAVLLVLALWTRFPYRRFFQTHRLLPLVYLALVFHSVVLTRDGAWAQPVGTVLAVLMAAGSIAALMVLFGAVGRSRQAVGQVVSVQLHEALDVLEVGVRLKSRWPGHDAGQFAFVRFDAAEGAHPFTITSPWTGDGRMVFLIKGLGDYTKTLPTRLRPGDLLRVEGPYGQFNFAGAKQRQIWVGGGIGIAPFIARLEQLALRPEGQSIDLFHTTGTRDASAFARLQAAARAAHVQLHLLVDSVDGFLSADRICAAVPEWRAAEVWFCGPVGFGRMLRHDLLAKGVLRRDFHQELFSLR